MAEAPFHTQVIQVIAYDPDSVTSIAYSLSAISFKTNRTNRIEDEAFTIDEDTGMVYTNKFHYLNYLNGYFSTTVNVKADGKHTSKLLQVNKGHHLLVKEITGKVRVNTYF